MKYHLARFRLLIVPLAFVLVGLFSNAAPASAATGWTNDGTSTSQYPIGSDGSHFFLDETVVSDFTGVLYNLGTAVHRNAGTPSGDIQVEVWDAPCSSNLTGVSGIDRYVVPATEGFAPINHSGVDGFHTPLSVVSGTSYCLRYQWTGGPDSVNFTDVGLTADGQVRKHPIFTPTLTISPSIVSGVAHPTASCAGVIGPIRAYVYCLPQTPGPLGTSSSQFVCPTNGTVVSGLFGLTVGVTWNCQLVDFDTGVTYATAAPYFSATGTAPGSATTTAIIGNIDFGCPVDETGIACLFTRVSVYLQIFSPFKQIQQVATALSATGTTEWSLGVPIPSMDWTPPDHHDFEALASTGDTPAIHSTVTLYDSTTDTGVANVVVHKFPIFRTFAVMLIWIETALIIILEGFLIYKLI